MSEAARVEDIKSDEDPCCVTYFLGCGESRLPGARITCFNNAAEKVRGRDVSVLPDWAGAAAGTRGRAGGWGVGGVGGGGRGWEWWWWWWLREEVEGGSRSRK